MVTALLTLLLSQAPDGGIDEKALLAANQAKFREAAAAMAKKKHLELLDLKVPDYVEEKGSRSVKIGAMHPPLATDVRPSWPLVVRDPKTKKLHTVWPEGKPGKQLKVKEKTCPTSEPGPPPPMMEVRANFPLSLGEKLEFGEQLSVEFEQTEVLREYPASCSKK